MKKITFLLCLMFATIGFCQTTFVYDPITGILTDQQNNDVNGQTINSCGNPGEFQIIIPQSSGATNDLTVQFENTTTAQTADVIYTANQLQTVTYIILPEFTFINWLQNGENGKIRFFNPALTAELNFNNVNNTDLSNLQLQYLVCENDTLQFNPTENGAINVDSFSVFSFLTGQTFTPDSNGYVYLLPSVYQVTGYNAFGCQQIAQIEIFESVVNFNLTFVNPTGCGANDGQILLNNLNNDSLYCVGYDQDTTTIKDIYLADQNGTVLIDSLSAGTYSNFMVQNSLGCTAYDSTTVITLVDPPVITPIVNASNLSLCSNAPDSSILQVVNASAYDSILWMPGNEQNPFVTFGPGTYYAEVIDTNNCEGVSNNLQIVEFDPIQPNVIASLDSICIEIGQSSILQVTNANDFTNINWLPTNAANPFETFSGGSFYAEVTDVNGCNTNSDTLEIVEIMECDPTASINELQNADILKTEYYTILGQKVEPKNEGLFIEVTTYANGQVTTKQILINK